MHTTVSHTKVNHVSRGPNAVPSNTRTNNTYRPLWAKRTPRQHVGRHVQTEFQNVSTARLNLILPANPNSADTWAPVVYGSYLWTHTELKRLILTRGPELTRNSNIKFGPPG